MKKRTILVAFLALSAILALMTAEILLIDRPRSPTIPSQKRYFDRPGGVLDSETGLFWMPAAPSEKDAAVFTRKKARVYCERSVSAGHKDWRLPTSDELVAIARCGHFLKRCNVILSRERKATCLRYHAHLSSRSYWTAEKSRRCGSAGGGRTHCARSVRIYRGHCGEYDAVTGMRAVKTTLRVFCVRSTKKGRPIKK